MSVGKLPPGSYGPTESWQTQVAPVVLAVQQNAVGNHAHEHVNILEYTEHFRAYMDLRNQGATNAG